MSPLIIAAIAAGAVALILIIWVSLLRRVVKTNEVHIVRRGRKTVVYGSLDENSDSSGNSYYKFPAQVPLLGVDVSILPLSVFSIDLNNYEAYDKDRLPFVVDIKAFFRISDYKIAASRIYNFDELKSQLLGIVQGAARSILAKEDLESIMSERSKYGEAFTKEVQEQLKHWGVEPVKNIELMDIRDAKGETVIANIMEKKKSQIEKESRVTVAKNKQEAQEAEIAAKQEVDLKQQEADKMVGLRKANVSKEVGIAEQQSSQAVQEETKTTKQKEMEVLSVDTVRRAQINKEAIIINAEGSKKTAELDADAVLIQTTKKAEGDLIVASKNAEGIALEGKAKADAEEKMQLALVGPKLKLAEKIGENEGYQHYLIEVRKIEATETVGLEQAKNLSGADIKIIANASGVGEGVTKALDVLTPQGGFNLAGALENFVSTDAGKAVLKKLGVTTE